MTLLDRFIRHPKFDGRESVYVRWYPKSLTAVDSADVGFIEGSRPEGAYVHVPFCDRLCHFCPFNKRVSDASLVERFVEALRQEIGLYARRIRDSSLRFIYFGGGTPSVLTPMQLSQIIEDFDRHFGLEPGCEITLEAHPTHIDRSSAATFRATGITRLSSGIQAFDDDMLRRLGAQHSSTDAHRAIDGATHAFGEMAVDLLFRCPEQDLAHWERQLKVATDFGAIGHISCYSLVLRDEAKLPSKRVEAEMTAMAAAFLRDKGYEHYASCASGGFDYAKGNRRCVYEETHWGAPQVQFLGLGPGAFGFLGGHTVVNGLDVSSYCRRILENVDLPLASATPMAREESMRRYFVLGVKTLRVPFRSFREEFGDEPQVVFAAEFSQLQLLELAVVTGDELVLTDLGRFFVDSISAMFFSSVERDVAHPEEREIRAVELKARAKAVGSDNPVGSL